MLNENEQQFFMRECLKLCGEAAAIGEIPIAAIVVRGGEIVGRGINRRKVESDPSAHAEIVAMRDAGKRLGVWNLSGCDIVVTLEPCAMCSGAIVNARIDNVYFGGYDVRFGYCGTLGNIASDERLNHRANVTGGILEEECLSLIREFFQNKRKQAKLDKKQF